MRPSSFAISALLFTSLVSVVDAYDLPYHGGVAYNEIEEKLIRKLFVDSDYNPLVRPVRNASEIVVVKFSVQLSQVILIDEKNQIMKSNVWLAMYWYDYQRVWNPKDYGLINTISVEAKNVWTPEIVLMNNVDGNYDKSYDSKVVLYADGNTMYIPPAIYQSSCKIDVTYFPYDEQICDMKFASWSFPRNELKLTWYSNASALMDDYLPSGTWDVLGSPAIIEEYYEMGIWKTHALFRFRIRRKTLYYVVNLIIPVVLISFVTPSVHFLPSDACEKITLSVSILITLVVFIFLVSKILPPFVVIPLIYKYLLFTLIMNVMAVLTAVIAINRSNRTPRTHGMPNWVRVVFLNHLPRLLLMKRPNHNQRWEKKTMINTQNERLCFGRDNVATRISTDFNAFKHSNCQLDSPMVPRKDNQNSGLEVVDEHGAMSDDLLEAVRSVKFIAQHIELEEEFDTVVEDWKYVALVMDRLLFYIGFITTTIGTLAILLNASGIFRKAGDVF